MNVEYVLSPLKCVNPHCFAFRLQVSAVLFIMLRPQSQSVCSDALDVFFSENAQKHNNGGRAKWKRKHFQTVV